MPSLSAYFEDPFRASGQVSSICKGVVLIFAATKQWRRIIAWVEKALKRPAVKILQKFLHSFAKNPEINLLALLYSSILFIVRFIFSFASVISSLDDGSAARCLPRGRGRRSRRGQGLAKIGR